MSGKSAREGDFIALMRALAGTAAARGLADDVAVLDDLVLTTDTLVEGVHFRPDDPAYSVGWKLAAVNLSDLAAKGAEPVGCLVNYMLSGDAVWDADFARGLGDALARFAMPVLGGDTVSGPPGHARSFTLTAIGRANGDVPARAGALGGDVLYITGPVGDAGAGLAVLQGRGDGPADLVAAYQTPQPRMATGLALAPLAHASMDISDGLLIDAQRMAAASGVMCIIEQVPLSPGVRALWGDDVPARVRAASAGDDYELLLAMAADFVPAPDSGLIRIGHVTQGAGLRLVLDGIEIPLPARLGWEHGVQY